MLNNQTEEGLIIMCVRLLNILILRPDTVQEYHKAKCCVGQNYHQFYFSLDY